eukprot:1434302-Amphidinium_carterae.1
MQLRMGQKAMVIIPGMASNALESKLIKNSELKKQNGKDACMDFADILGGDSFLDWELSYVNVFELATHGPRTFRSLMLELSSEELSRGETLPCTVDAPVSYTHLRAHETEADL